MKHQQSRLPLCALSLVTAALLAACGGGGTTSAPTTLSGKVIDGYISGASVCLDINGNKTCDAGEPQTTTGADGSYSLVAPAGIDLNNTHLIANVPVGAVDSVTGPVTSAYKMLAPASMPSAVTPLTTAISAQMMANNLSVARARLAARADLSVPIDYDFAKDHIATSDTAALNVARVMAATLAKTVGTGTPSASNLADALNQIKILSASAYASADVNGVVNSLLTPQITFEINDTSGYNLISFGGNGASVESSPPAGGNGKAAKIVRPANAESWAGTTFLNLSAANKEMVSAANRSVSVRVHSPVGVPVRLKLEQASDPTKNVEVQITTTKDGWQTLVFDTNNPYPGTSAYSEEAVYDMASIFFNFGATPGSGADQTYYLDDVYFTPASLYPVAPAPTYLAANVISLFSDSYTNATNVTWLPQWQLDWTGNRVADTAFLGNAVKLYTALDFVVPTFEGANSINVSTMTHFNIDVLPVVSTQFCVKLVDFGANNSYQGGDDTEGEKCFTNLTAGTWNTLRIPLTEFTGLTGKAHLSQLVFSSLPTGTSKVYIDNVFFNR